MTADRELTEAKRDKLHDIVEVAGESNRKLDRKHEDTEIDGIRAVTGLVALVALLYVVVELMEPLSLILSDGGRSIHLIGWLVIVTAPAGWGGLVYVCWIRSGRITGTASAFVLVLGGCGMVISPVALGLGGGLMPTVFLTGTWILYGLGIVWIVHKVRRIMAASNTDAADVEP